MDLSSAGLGTRRPPRTPRHRQALLARPARLAIAAVILAAWLGQSSPAQAEKHPARHMFGFTTGVAPWTAATQDDFTLMRQANLRFHRFNMTWAGLEKSSGALDLSTTDATVGAAASAGIRTIPVLWGTPRWATGCNDPSFKYCWALPPTVSPDAQAAWVGFVQTLVSRYGRHGSFWAEHPEISYEPVKVWQIWNEPNLDGFFGPRPSPHGYAHLVDVTADAIHAQDPRARIALAGIAPGTAKGNWPAKLYMRHLLRVRGVKRSFDVAAVHPYYGSVPGVRKFVGGVAKALRRGAPHKSLWISEEGWSSLGEGGKHFKGPRGQAKLVRGTFNMYLDHKRAWNLTKVIYFAWRDLPFCQPGCWGNSAGFHYEDMRPKPAWKQFQRLVKSKG
jgi:hypothetical protein